MSEHDRFEELASLAAIGELSPEEHEEFQRHKVRGTITHVDLQEVRLDQPIQTAVSITLVGEPVGVKEGGVLNQVANEVNIEALPLEVPQHSSNRFEYPIRRASSRFLRPLPLPPKGRPDRRRQRQVS